MGKVKLGSGGGGNGLKQGMGLVVEVTAGTYAPLQAAEPTRCCLYGRLARPDWAARVSE